MGIPPTNQTTDAIAWVRRLREEADQLRLAVGPPQAGSSQPATFATLVPNVPPPDFLEGYAFVREIHRGGQGVVYEALQTATRRPVAIKLFHGIKPNSRAARRFEREAELITQLRHPNVVTVLDAGHVADSTSGGSERGGVFFLIMEHVDGMPIDQYVASRLMGVDDGTTLGSIGVPPVSGSAAVPSARTSGGVGAPDIDTQGGAGILPAANARSQLPRTEKRRRKAALDELLRLFAKVCDGVAAAHLKGIIHRDLKPANILVDADGQPRVLDFGLAKLENDNSESSVRPSAAAECSVRTSECDGGPLGSGFPSSSTSADPGSPPNSNIVVALGGATATTAPTCTLDGQFVGSLPWASPEQAAGDQADIDIRTDVYSLGVVLYQLLSGGRFPYEIKGTIREVRERIATATPEPLRGSVAASLDRVRIDSDIEAIVQKCLSKNREGRYQSAGDVAAEVRRRMANQPIAARSGQWRYRATKFLYRNYRSIGTMTAVVATIIVVTLAYLQRESKWRDELAAISLVNGRLDELEWYGHSVDSSLIRSQRAGELVRRLDGRRFEDPEVECQIRHRLALALGSVAHPEATHQYELALAAANAIVPPRVDYKKRAFYGLVGYAEHGLSAQQEAYFIEWLALFDTNRSLTPQEEIERLEVIARFTRAKGAFDEHNEAMDQLLQLLAEVAPEQLGDVEKRYAECLCDDQNRFDEAYVHQVVGLEWQRKYYSGNVADSLHSFGHLLIKMSRFDEAAFVMSECVILRDNAYGRTHRNSFYLFRSQSQYAEALTGAGRFEEAEAQLNAARSGFELSWSPRWLGYERESMLAMMQRFATLYERWSTISGDDRHAQLAAEWQERLCEYMNLP